jgi:anti-sigma factor RsiW
MITCQELAELLNDFLSGELPADHRQRIDQHLGKCPPCSHLVETYQVTISLSRQLICGDLPCSCEQRLRELWDRHCQQEQA